MKTLKKRWKLVIVTQGELHRLLDEKGFKEIYECTDILDGAIEEIIKRFEFVKNALEEAGYKNIKLETIHEWENIEIRVNAERLETEKEAQQRVDGNKRKKEIEKKKKAKKEDLERVEYERLKKKYDR